jgi:hypothetical protein
MTRLAGSPLLPCHTLVYPKYPFPAQVWRFPAHLSLTLSRETRSGPAERSLSTFRPGQGQNGSGRFFFALNISLDQVLWIRSP